MSSIVSDLSLNTIFFISICFFRYCPPVDAVYTLLFSILPFFNPYLPPTTPFIFSCSCLTQTLLLLSFVLLKLPASFVFAQTPHLTYFPLFFSSSPFPSFFTFYLPLPPSPEQLKWTRSTSVFILHTSPSRSPKFRPASPPALR